MNQQTYSRAMILAVMAALFISSPGSARGGAASGPRGGSFSGRGSSVPRTGTFSPSRSAPTTRDGGRTPGSLDRGTRGGGRGSGDLRPGTGGGRRGPSDRPDWDGKTPGRHHGHGRDHGHSPGWWYSRPGYWGGFGYWGGLGYGGFYDPFYNPFYSYRDLDEDGERTDDRNIEVRVQPADAQVYVNGLLYSNSGKARFTLPSGPWTVELRAPGYRTERIELSVEQGKRYKIERKLQRDETFGRDGKPLKSEELDNKRR